MLVDLCKLVKFMREYNEYFMDLLKGLFIELHNPQNRAEVLRIQLRTEFLARESVGIKINNTFRGNRILTHKISQFLITYHA